jgi:hypothetical protein
MGSIYVQTSVFPNMSRRVCCVHMPDERIRELLFSAQENRRGFIKNDPVEKTEEYLAAIDKVEEKIDKAKQMNFCLEYWNLKAQFLFEHGILWRSPAQLNPGVMFD